MGIHANNEVISAEPTNSNESHLKCGKGDRIQPKTKTCVGPHDGEQHQGQRKGRSFSHSAQRIFRCRNLKTPSCVEPARCATIDQIREVGGFGYVCGMRIGGDADELCKCFRYCLDVSFVCGCCEVNVL